MEAEAKKVETFPWLAAVKPRDVSYAAHEAYMHADQPAALALFWYPYTGRRAPGVPEQEWGWVLIVRGQKVRWLCGQDRAPVPTAWANALLAGGCL